MTTQSVRATQSLPSTTRPFASLYAFALLLVLVGLGISGYLTYVKFTDTPMACVQGGAFNCSVVQASSYSMLLGVPVAFLGLLSYITLGGLLLAERALPSQRDMLQLASFGVALFAFLFSMWLVYVQAVLLEAFCVWCLAHEANITVLFGVLTVRLMRMLSTPAADIGA